jgi:phosphopantetheinyl transferase
MWVRKESALKITGEGLTRAPNAIAWDDPATQFYDIDVGTGYYAVIALTAPVMARIAVVNARPLVAAAARLWSPTA